ncbi:peptidase M56 [Virgibacillus necropolis]|uniref:peptidase M56 n=1 Tax=Virgibacillus necropolis TaxID=163877 RepID=UPI00384A9EA6
MSYPSLFPTKVYKSSTYKVSLRFPAHWMQIPGYDERYGAEDGFFQLSAISSGGATINELAYQEAFHQLNPYGTNPSIFRKCIDGEEVRLILPSIDQPLEMMRQAALIVEYPTPINISGETYDYFILWSDIFHIFCIAQTIHFTKRK